MMHRNKSVDQHVFAMVPRADVPRAAFKMESSHKTTFDAGYLIPVYCEEVLPGDTFNVNMTAFVRLSTPLFPIMDNVYLDSFFFFVPNRLVWNNWVKFMGEQDNPDDSIDYLVPTITSPAGGFSTAGIYDYFGLPVELEPSSTVEVSALPLRGYNLIWNEWFRDENIQDSYSEVKSDGPDSSGAYALRRRGKRHDYFTSCLPWPQKGEAVTLPLGGIAPVYTYLGTQVSGAREPMHLADAATGTALSGTRVLLNSGEDMAQATGALGASVNTTVYPSNLAADLNEATNLTINALRQSMQIQRLLERDARGGTRYTEIVRSHFGVVSPDARLQRPEYLGGGSTPLIVNPIAQTSGTGIGSETTPLGNLAAVGTSVMRNGFTGSFTEHGYIIGLVSARADMAYQQGLRRHWSRQTRYDFYFPAFAHLGEQAVLLKEIYAKGTSDDDNVFGYQERWAEYRYSPSLITSYMRSDAPTTLDAWHLAQNFSSPPSLSDSFIREFPPIDRVLAAPVANTQFIADIFFAGRVARPMPLYSVPGMMDHF